MWLLLWLLGVLSVATNGGRATAALDSPTGGARYFTTHALTEPLDDLAHTYAAFPDRRIKEWHFHVYFFQERADSVAAALRMQSRIVRAVAQGELIVVCDGITADILPALNESEVPPVNTGPVGPHPAGSFETWVPAEHLAAALSLFMLYREELSILIHPLTAHTIEDHTGRAMWLGSPWPIDRTVLSSSGGDPPQYRELGLGYSAAAARVVLQQRRLSTIANVSAPASNQGLGQRIAMHTFLANQRSDNVQIYALLAELDRRSDRVSLPRPHNTTVMDL